MFWRWFCKNLKGLFWPFRLASSHPKAEKQIFRRQASPFPFQIELFFACISAIKFYVDKEKFANFILV